MGKGMPGGNFLKRVEFGGPAVIFLLVVLVVAAVFVFVNWVNADPDVIRAKAELANAQASLIDSRAPIVKDLPEVFRSAAPFLGVVGVVFTVLLVTGAVTFWTVAHKVDTLLSHGVVVQKNQNGQVSSWKIEQTHPMQLGAGRPNIKVDTPMFPTAHQQALPPKTQGRKLRPEEVQSPDRKGRSNPAYTPLDGGGIPVQLSAGHKLSASSEDPLDDLE